MHEPSDYSGPFAERLRAMGLEPVLVGALAAATYRKSPRFTTDVDFMVREFADAAERFADEGYDIKSMSEPGGDPYLIFVRGKGVKVDLMLAETDYHRGAMERSVDGVLAIEDVIVSKLLAWRARDRDDIDSIMSTDPDLDDEYVHQWAEVWEVTDRWAEVRRRFGTG